MADWGHPHLSTRREGGRPGTSDLGIHRVEEVKCRRKLRPTQTVSCDSIGRVRLETARSTATITHQRPIAWAQLLVELVLTPLPLASYKAAGRLQ